MLPVQFHKNFVFNKEIPQELKITDHFKRYPFADWLVEKTEVIGDFTRRDKTNIHLSGFVNNQNCVFGQMGIR